MNIESRPFYALVSWRSTIAGFALSLMTLAALLALAVAFGGIGLDDGASVQGAGFFAGIAVVIATVIAVFIGSYFSVRLSRFKVDVVGCSQGLILGSLVVLFVLWQSAAAVNVLAKSAAQATGATVAAVGTAVTAAAQQPVVQNLIEDNLGATTLKSDTEVVVRGVASRMMRGDHEGARNYLVFQSGLSREEADARIATVRAKVDEFGVRVREASATALKTSGWSVFVLIALSAIASILGGLWASQVNVRGTLDSHNEIVGGKPQSPIKTAAKPSINTFDKPART